MQFSFEGGFKDGKVLIKVSYFTHKDRIEEFKNKGYKVVKENGSFVVFKVSRKVFYGGL